MITMLTTMIDTGVSYKTLLPWALAVTLLRLDVFPYHQHAPAGCMQACKVYTHSLILAEMQPLPLSVTAKKHVSECSGQTQKA